MLRVLVARLVEPPPSVQKAVGSNPVMSREVIFVYCWFEKQWRQKLEFITTTQWKK